MSCCRLFHYVPIWLVYNTVDYVIVRFTSIFFSICWIFVSSSLFIEMSYLALSCSLDNGQQLKCFADGCQAWLDNMFSFFFLCFISFTFSCFLRSIFDEREQTNKQKSDCSECSACLCNLLSIVITRVCYQVLPNKNTNKEIYRDIKSTDKQK